MVTGDVQCVDRMTFLNLGQGKSGYVADGYHLSLNAALKVMIALYIYIGLIKVKCSSHRVGT